MAATYLLVWLAFFVVDIKATVLSFGIRILDSTLNEVELQLYWGQERYQCNVYPSTSYTSYTCFANTSVIQTSSNNIEQQYFMQITNDHMNSVWIDAIMVSDDHNHYIMDEFCAPDPLSDSLLYSARAHQSSVNRCDSTVLTSMDGFAIDIDDHKIVSIMAHFRGNLLNYVNNGYPGYITSANVHKFGIMTASNIISAANAEVTLTLHWNWQIMQCTINPSAANTSYFCYANDVTTTACLNDNTHDNVYKLHIDHDDSDTLQIESFVVYDESTSYYGIDTFCVDINAVQSGVSPLNNSCSTPLQFSLFEDICLDNVHCNNTHMDVSFGTDMFQNPNSFRTHGVVTTGFELSPLTCAPTTQPTLAPSTQQPTYSSTDDYIHAFVGPISWTEANKYCFDRFNTSLAFIGRHNDNGEAANLVHLESVSHDLPIYAFFGLNKLYDIDGSWRFAGSRGSYTSDFNYFNWDVSAGQPGTDACAIMGESGLWYTTSCTARQNVSILCNRYAEIIDDTWSTKYTYVFVGEMSWPEANVFCNTHYNTTLATVSSADDNTEIASFAAHQVAKYAIIKRLHSFIGLHDLGDDTQWTWIDGTQATYYNWAPTLVHNPSESCSAISTNGFWDERGCHDSLPNPFFCNKPSMPAPSPTPKQTTNPTSANYSAVYTSNMNYIFVFGGLTTWFEANDYCRTQFSTSLASITSAEENTEITYSSSLQYIAGATATRCSFIGLHRMHSAIDWDWIDGSHSNYTYWHSGEPNPDYMCSQMCSTWRSTSCYTKYARPFVCTAPKEIVTGTPTELPTNAPNQMDTYSSTTASLFTTTLYGKEVERMPTSDNSDSDTVLIILAAVIALLAIGLCLVSCVCYKKNKLLRNAVEVNGVDPETRHIVEQTPTHTVTGDEDDTESKLIDR
eukprot:309669_1